MEERPRPIEGIDFYRENGRIVFTSTYHLRRGHCCGCHCRNCPWKEDYNRPITLNIILPNEKNAANDDGPDEAA